MGVAGGVDHHVHLFGPCGHEWFERAVGRELPPFTAEELLPVMDSGGIEVAVALSVGYFFGRADGPLPPDPKMIVAENDWVAAEVARYPDRLRAFLSVNPLLPESLGEIERCAGLGAFRGVKLHLTNSNVELRDSADVMALSTTCTAAASFGLPVVVHLRTRRPDFGAVDVRAFLDGVVAPNPGLVVQVAHVGGWGGYDPVTDDGLIEFARWLSDHPLDRERVWFDVSAVVRGARALDDREPPDWYPEGRYARLADCLRSIGLERVLFGTDWPEWTPSGYAVDLEEVPWRDGEREALLRRRAPWLS